MGFWCLIAGTDLEHEFAKLFVEVTLRHVALLHCVNLQKCRAGHVKALRH